MNLSTSSNEPRREDPLMDRIKRLARESKEGAADDFEAAVGRFRDVLKTKHPDLALYLVRREFEDATRAEIERLVWGQAGVQMQVNARNVAPDPAAEERLKRKRQGQAAFAEKSLLLSYTVDGRPLAYLTKAEVEAKAKADRIEAGFLTSVAALIPTDEAQVKDHVTDAQAKAALRQAKAA